MKKQSATGITRAIGAASSAKRPELGGLGILGFSAFLALASIFFGAWACSSSVSKQSCPSNSTLTYDNFGKDFFNNRCQTCHARDQDPHFATRAEISAHLDEVYDQTVIQNKMPPGGLSSSDKQKLADWLSCGAK